MQETVQKNYEERSRMEAEHALLAVPHITLAVPHITLYRITLDLLHNVCSVKPPSTTKTAWYRQLHLSLLCFDSVCADGSSAIFSMDPQYVQPTSTISEGTAVECQLTGVAGSD